MIENIKTSFFRGNSYSIWMSHDKRQTPQYNYVAQLNKIYVIVFGFKLLMNLIQLNDRFFSLRHHYYDGIEIFRHTSINKRFHGPSKQIALN